MPPCQTAVRTLNAESGTMLREGGKGDLVHFKMPETRNDSSSSAVICSQRLVSGQRG